LRATHLQDLARQVGFDYARLDQPAALLRALRDPRFARRELVRMDLSWILASLALLLLIGHFLPTLGDLMSQLRQTRGAQLVGSKSVVAKANAERTPVPAVYEDRR
jgi:hypothetical protein